MSATERRYGRRHAMTAPDRRDYWHGSPHFITDDLIVPGAVLGRSRYGMRNKVVFLSVTINGAVGMGSMKCEDRDDGLTYFRRGGEEISDRGARFLYLCEPVHVMDLSDEYCIYDRCLDYEIACGAGRILRRFRCVNPWYPDRQPGFFYDPPPLRYVEVGGFRQFTLNR